MVLDIFPTTAENIIAVTEAVTTREDGCDINYVAQFMDVPNANALNAIEMAKQLGLISQDSPPGSLLFSKKPYAPYLVTAKDTQKAAVLRLVIEDFEPFQFFKQRLVITNVASQAAGQVKVRYNLSPHRDEIRDTLISLGTFAQSLVTEGAGLFTVTDFEKQDASFLQVIAQVATDRGIAEVAVRQKLGDEAANWIDQQQVLDPLITAYQRIGLGIDSRACVVYAGNAIESFLVQLAGHHGIELGRANGINSKADRFNNTFNSKHINMLKYLGHVRNAADHGVDAEIGNAWDISMDSAIQYVHVAISTIKSIVDTTINNRYII